MFQDVFLGDSQFFLDTQINSRVLGAEGDLFFSEMSIKPKRIAKTLVRVEDAFVLHQDKKFLDVEVATVIDTGGKERFGILMAMTKEQKKLLFPQKIPGTKKRRNAKVVIEGELLKLLKPQLKSYYSNGHSGKSLSVVGLKYLRPGFTVKTVAELEEEHGVKEAIVLLRKGVEARQARMALMRIMSEYYKERGHTRASALWRLHAILPKPCPAFTSVFVEEEQDAERLERGLAEIEEWDVPPVSFDLKKALEDQTTDKANVWHILAEAYAKQNRVAEAIVFTVLSANPGCVDIADAMMAARNKMVTPEMITNACAEAKQCYCFKVSELPMIPGEDDSIPSPFGGDEVVSSDDYDFSGRKRPRQPENDGADIAYWTSLASETEEAPKFGESVAILLDGTCTRSPTKEQTAVRWTVYANFERVPGYPYPKIICGRGLIDPHRQRGLVVQSGKSAVRVSANVKEGQFLVADCQGGAFGVFDPVPHGRNVIGWATKDAAKGELVLAHVNMDPILRTPLQEIQSNLADTLETTLDRDAESILVNKHGKQFDAVGLMAHSMQNKKTVVLVSSRKEAIVWTRNLARSALEEGTKTLILLPSSVQHGVVNCSNVDAVLVNRINTLSDGDVLYVLGRNTKLESQLGDVSCLIFEQFDGSGWPQEFDFRMQRDADLGYVELCDGVFNSRERHIFQALGAFAVFFMTLFYGIGLEKDILARLFAIFAILGSFFWRLSHSNQKRRAEWIRQKFAPNYLQEPSLTSLLLFSAFAALVWLAVFRDSSLHVFVGFVVIAMGYTLY